MNTAKKSLIICIALLTGINAIRAASPQEYKNLRYGERRSDLYIGCPDDRILDIMVPGTPAPANGYPCIVWVHGGGFRSGRRHYPAFAQEALSHGYAIVCVSYYLYLKNNYPKEITPEMKAAQARGLTPEYPYIPIFRKAVDAAAEDVEMALSWLANNKKQYKLDTDKVILCGGSAGAITCLDVAYARRKNTGAEIIVVIDLWGALDNIEKIQAPAPRLVILHGEKDRTVSAGYAKKLKEQMEKLNIKNLCFIFPGQPHNPQYNKGQVHTEIIRFLDEAVQNAEKKE